MMAGGELRAALYHRFRWLYPLTISPRARRFWRVLGWSLCAVYFAFVALVLALRYSILPNIEHYRGDIERLATQRLGRPVTIGRIESSWQGINPDLTLLDVRIADAEGRPALVLSRVEAVLSWWSVSRLELNLRLLRIEEPTLNLRRDAAGRLFVAGMPVAASDGDSAFGDWVLAQHRLRIEGATLVWEDELRQAPALVLEDVNLALDNDGRTHRFGVTAVPPESMASKVDLRGELHGRGFERLKNWNGQVFAEMAYADLAVWQRWVDYPLRLPQGRGAFRTWLTFSDGRPSAVTSDVALRDVQIQLAERLPMLDLERVSGRLSGRFPAKGFSVDGRAVEIVSRRSETTADSGTERTVHRAARIAPTDFHVDWQPLVGGKDGLGNVSASQLDLTDLALLADYLPLDAKSRELLAHYAPQGKINGLSAKWKGSPEMVQTYSVKAGFAGLAWKAEGDLPGVSGLTGSLEANEKEGRLSLDTQRAVLDLPKVFPEPEIVLDTLRAQARWTVAPNGVEVTLKQADFSGPDATGSARGTYRTSAEGPGTIDMTAALTRGEARAVWRFMPQVVGEGARHWLRDSLISGQSPEAHLVLKGNLADFPFIDKRKGEFVVTVKARDVVLDYAKGWPRIEGISGDLRFEGNGMVVNAEQGRMLGAKFSNTRVEIPDFDKPISTLHIKGRAEGPTAEFLKFIEASPVGERIDHFTEDMRATGNGVLDLGLTIPLDEAKLAESKVEGTYQFKNNDVTVDAALPPIRQVNGTLRFSESDLKIPEVAGNFLGGPLKIKGETQKDGRMAITAVGTTNLAQLRKQTNSPWLDYLSGAVTYRGEVRVNKRAADLVIDSNLVGLASSLPEPFGKNAADVLNLHFEKKSLPPAGNAARDQINVTLGNLASAQLVRRRQETGFAVDQGAVGVGRPAGTLPARGVAFGMTAKRLDVDAWRKILAATSAAPASTSAPTSAASTTSSSLPDVMALRVDDLTAFGRHITDLDLTATSAPGLVKARFTSPQANGDVTWESAGRGKLTARLGKLQLESSSLEPTAEVSQKATDELPALDVTADDFSLGTRRFGKLELQARNESGIWRLDRVALTNPAGEFAGSGQWQPGVGKNRTQLAFKVDSSDTGKLLDRLGYPGTVKGGTAHLDGNLAWAGSPVDFDYGTLSGDMKVEVSKGQFLKADPGVGKLLGLLSLQGVVRRLTFDFNDVFGKGFAFDTVAAKAKVDNGVMHTDRLQIDGPAARVLMSGDVDLKRETQRLNVKIQPEMGGTAALGVGIVNPVAGVATWVAHKILQNPLNQIFSYEYLITGTWDEPEVEKKAHPPAPGPNDPANTGATAPATGGGQ